MVCCDQAQRERAVTRDIAPGNDSVHGLQDRYTFQLGDFQPIIPVRKPADITFGTNQTDLPPPPSVNKNIISSEVS